MLKLRLLQNNMNLGFNDKEKQNSFNPLLDEQAVFLSSFCFLFCDFFGYNGSKFLSKPFIRSS